MNTFSLLERVRYKCCINLLVLNINSAYILQFVHARVCMERYVEILPSIYSIIIVRAKWKQYFFNFLYFCEIWRGFTHGFIYALITFHYLSGLVLGSSTAQEPNAIVYLRSMYKDSWESTYATSKPTIKDRTRWHLFSYFLIKWLFS